MLTSKQRSYLTGLSNDLNPIVQVGKDGVENSRLSRAFQALNRITCIKYPFFRRFPVLLPIGWVLAFGCYLIRTYKRNRRGKQIHVLSAYQKSAPRIRLYQSLGIYESEIS